MVIDLTRQLVRIDSSNPPRNEARIYGRGTTDMKGGVAAMVVAAINRARGLDRSAGLVVVVNAGEETGAEGGVRSGPSRLAWRDRRHGRG